jgi:hypothetical protein
MMANFTSGLPLLGGRVTSCRIGIEPGAVERATWVGPAESFGLWAAGGWGTSDLGAGAVAAGGCGA